MPDFTDFIGIIKQAAIDAVKAAKPVEVLCGRVASVDPLRIDFGQGFVLEGSQLTLTRAVTRHAVTVDAAAADAAADAGGSNNGSGSGSGSADGGGSGGGAAQYTVDSSLKEGDQALLIQRQGGQQYIVIGVLP